MDGSAFFGIILLGLAFIGCMHIWKTLTPWWQSMHMNDPSRFQKRPGPDEGMGA